MKRNKKRGRAETVLGNRWIVALLSLVLVAATIATYASGLSAAFVCDDRDTIVWDKHLGDFSSLSRVLAGVRGGPTGGRPLTSLSFHLNSLFAGQNPAGYRAINVLIHIGAGLTLFGLLRRILPCKRGTKEQRGDGTDIAFAASLLWLVHPLQTESVTYISQRAESLMGFMFLAAVYCAVRGFQAEAPTPWFRAATVACVLSVLSKEVGVAVPLVVLIYDSLLISRGWRQALKKHRGLYAGLAFSWLVAGLLQLSAPRGYSVALSNPELSPWGYLQRQLVGVTNYLRLVFWPAPLIFDYGFPPVPSALRLIAAATLLAVVVTASILALQRWQLAGLAGISFFLVLAPSSSVIPILTEVLAEHRMYLPLACVVTLVVSGVAALTRAGEGPHKVKGRDGLTIGSVVLLLCAGATLAVTTWQRNVVFRSELSLWQDTVSKLPDNPRAQNNLGMALLEAGNTSEALAHFREAVAIRPGFFEANGNSAIALERLGQLSEALVYMRRAVDLNPVNEAVQEGLVRLLTKLNRWDEALAAARAYVGRSPGGAHANALYGSLLSRLGRSAEAAPHP